MIEVQKVIYSRLTNDSALQTLLGGAGRIFAGFQNVQGVRPSIAFMSWMNPGSIDADAAKSYITTWQFNIYANTFQEISRRLLLLLNNQRLPANTETGKITMAFESEMPSDFDDELKVSVKAVRYRSFFTPKTAATP
jgi:hypothetical protein